MKKATGVLLALLLAALLLPGALVRAEASELDEGVLNTKVQTTTGVITSTKVAQYQGKYVMRFVSSVGDPELYLRVGFEISYEDGGQTVKKTYTTHSVFRRIESTTGSTASGKDQYSFSPKVVSPASEYFFTAKWPVAPEDVAVNYTVRAFAVTKAGETVYGPSRCVSVNDGSVSGNIVLSFDQTLDANTAYTVSYTNASGATVNIPAANVEILPVFEGEENHANVRLTNADANVKAVTEVTISDGTNSYTTELKNLYAAYNGTGDTSWYSDSESKFVLTSAAELHGLSALAVSKNFSGKTVYLASDIKLNDGNAADWATTAPANEFTPIGGDSGSFRGTFDGQGHTISGLYATGAHRVALFGNAYDCTIRNFRLTNSYLSSSTAFNGSVAGNFRGTVEKVYSNAIIRVAGAATSGNAAAYATGGMVGRIDSTNSTFDQCWFDGSITVNGTRVGGIVGEHFTNGVTVNINNCLVTGDITTTVQQANGCAGGFLGQIWSNNTSSAPRLNIANSVFAGTVTHALSGGNMVGLAVGGVSAQSDTGGVWLSNCYCAPSNNWNIVGWQAGTATVTDDGGDIAYTGSCTELSRKYRHELPDLPSLCDEDGLLAQWRDTEIWRVYQAAFDAGIAQIDLTWYDEGESVYTVSSAPQLLGMAYLNDSRDGVFTGKTVKLGADISLNKDTVADWKASDFAGLTVWTPVGMTYAFRGSFDGQGHTVSGLYVNNNGRTGLFANAYDGEIKDFRLTNSYLKNTAAINGSIVGNFRGTMERVYSDAELAVTLPGSGQDGLTGGLVGRIASNTTISECWYAGTVSTNGKCIGGIVGAFQNETATLTVANCLVTGTLNSSVEVSNHNQAMGGIIGSVVGMSGATKACLNSDIFTGTLTATDTAANMVGFLVGAVNGSDLTRGVWLSGSYGVASGKGAGPIGYQLGGMVTDDNGATKYTGSCAGLTAKYAKKLSALTVAVAGLSGDVWLDSKKGPILPLTLAAMLQDVPAMSGAQMERVSDEVGSCHFAEMSGTTLADYRNYLTTLEGNGFVKYADNGTTGLNGNVYTAVYTRGEKAVSVIYRAKLNTTYIAAEEIPLSQRLFYSADYVQHDLPGAKTTLHMLETKGGGNSFVIQLKNGHFLVLDGGNYWDADYLLSYLESLAPTGEKPVVEGW
ncbi:MAG: hypothetical protein IJU18_01745, partial [Oscillospiraceae bacterium]|nr:hypothetical protein [Oscillospiraceae bacterium]